MSEYDPSRRPLGGMKSIRSRARRRRRGETLLELLIAIALFALVFVAFATVFPAGYRLNLTNLNESKAVHFGTAVIEEVNGMPFGRVKKMVVGAAGTGWPEDPDATLGFDNFPRIVDQRHLAGAVPNDIDLVRIPKDTTFPKQTNVYFLPEAPLAAIDGVAIKRGIEVTVDSCTLPGFSSFAGEAFAPALEVANVTTNLYWFESRRKNLVLRTMTITARRPSNLVNQGGY